MLNQSSELHAAVLSGDFDRVKRLIKVEPQAVNQVDSFGSFPVLDATKLNYSEIVSLLLKSGARVDVFDSSGDSPLSAAWATGNSQLVECVIESLRRNGVAVDAALDNPNRSLIFSDLHNPCSILIRKAGLTDPYQ
jgi:ankyrin repeat protein